MLAKRYGGLPTDYMKLSVSELTANLQVALIGMDVEAEAEQEAMDRAEAEASLNQKSRRL